MTSPNTAAPRPEQRADDDAAAPARVGAAQGGHQPAREGTERGHQHELHRAG